MQLGAPALEERHDAVQKRRAAQALAQLQTGELVLRSAAETAGKPALIGSEYVYRKMAGARKDAPAGRGAGETPQQQRRSERNRTERIHGHTREPAPAGARRHHRHAGRESRERSAELARVDRRRGTAKRILLRPCGRIAERPGHRFSTLVRAHACSRPGIDMPTAAAASPVVGSRGHGACLHSSDGDLP